MGLEKVLKNYTDREPFFVFGASRMAASTPSTAGRYGTESRYSIHDPLAVMMGRYAPAASLRDHYLDDDSRDEIDLSLVMC
jgi:hypothetical protein